MARFDEWHSWEDEINLAAESLVKFKEHLDILKSELPKHILQSPSGNRMGDYTMTIEDHLDYLSNSAVKFSELGDLRDIIKHKFDSVSTFSEEE